MALQLGGLSSGLDTNTIIEQLIAIERRPAVKLRQKERLAQTREAALRDVSTRLKNLKSAATGLRSPTLWTDTQTVESTDSLRVAAKRLSSAGAGSYNVEVTQLARAEQRTYAYTANGAATTMTVGGVAVDIAANATVDEAVSSINSTAGITVTASNVGGQIVMTANQTGTASAFTATGATIAEDATKARVALDALYKVDGVSKTSSKNVVTDGIVGLELSLKGLTPTGTPVTITVGAPGPDAKAVKDKLKAFVDQYNSTYEFLKGKVEERPVRDPKTEADQLKGVLFGDSLLRNTLSQLRTGAMDAVAGNVETLDELRELGISTGGTTGAGSLASDSVSGKLVFDEAKFDAAMATDPAQVKRLLGAVPGVDGVSQRFEGLIDPVTGIGGSIDVRVTGAQAEMARIKRDLTALDKRLALRETYLRRQFEQMEKALSRSQSQGGFLSGQLQF